MKIFYEIPTSLKIPFLSCEPKFANYFEIFPQHFVIGSKISQTLN